MAARGRAVVRRGTARARLGRDGRSVQHGGQGHGQPAAAQARRAAGDRDRRPGRLPHMRPAGSRAAAASGSGYRAVRRAVPRRRGDAARHYVRTGQPRHRTASSYPAPTAGGGRAGPVAAGRGPAAALPADRPAAGPGADAGSPAARAKAAENDALLLYSGIALGIMAVVSIGARLVRGRPRAAPAAADHRGCAADLRHEPARAARGRGPDDDLRELADTFDDLLRPPGRVVRRAAPVRRQRLARAAHPARPLADHARSRAPRPRRGRRVAARHLRAGARRRARNRNGCSRRCSRSRADSAASTAARRSTWPPSPGTCWRRAARRSRQAGWRWRSRSSPRCSAGDRRPHRTRRGQPHRQRPQAQRGRRSRLGHGPDRIRSGSADGGQHRPGRAGGRGRPPAGPVRARRNRAVAAGALANHRPGRPRPGPWPANRPGDRHGTRRSPHHYRASRRRRAYCRARLPGGHQRGTTAKRLPGPGPRGRARRSEPGGVCPATRR